MVLKPQRFKGISPLISTVIIIALAFAIGALVAPYTLTTVSDISNDTSGDVVDAIKCRNMAYDFVSGYGTDGVLWNFSGNETLLEVRIINTGTLNAHTFSFEIVLNGTNGLQILHYDTNSTYQKTASSPLKPGHDALLRADISADLNGTLQEVKILNTVCPNVFVRQVL